MKKTLLVALVVLIASVALLAAAPGYEKLARLSVWNRTGDTIYIRLTTGKEDGSLFYYLTVKPGYHVFTVQRKIYDVKYWSCGSSMLGVADVLTNLSLTFTDCRYLHRWTYTLKYYPVAHLEDGTPVYPRYYSPINPNAMNFGEPGMEKVHTYLRRWEWRYLSTKCWGAPWYNTADGLWYQDWGGNCAAGRNWGLRGYRSPNNTGDYWDSYRFSYGDLSTRSIHWTRYYDKMELQSR
jgi:hypothetical protein